MKLIYAVLVSCIACLASPASAQSWRYDFNGTSVDPSMFLISDYQAPGAIADNAIGYFTPANVSVANGYLSLLLTQQNGTVGTNANGVISYGGELQSVQTYGYGTYEWRMRMSSTASTPAGPGSQRSGSVSAGFNFINNSQTEIDFEAEGQSTNLSMTNRSGITNSTSFSKTIAGMDAGFKTYSYAWSPGRIDFYVDGVLQGSNTTNVPTAPAYFMLNHWGTNSTSWGGPATVGVNRTMYVDWVRYTAPGQTPIPAIFYVRAGAAGNGSGSDWANACADFTGACAASSLQRGAVYYVAAGNYGAPRFDASESGASPITIRAATAADHGTSAGWSGSYAVGSGQQAHFAYPILFLSSFWNVDGVTGTGANASSYGFTVDPPAICGDQYFIRIGNDISTITNLFLSHFALAACGGDLEKEGIYDQTQTTLLNSTFSFNYFNGFEDAFQLGVAGAGNILIEGNYMANAFSSPSHHGDNIDLFSVSTITIRNNIIHDCVGTGCIVANDTGSACVSGVQNASIYGNLIGNATSGNGMIAATTLCFFKNAKVYNNTFYSSGQTHWFGGCMSGAAACSNATGNVAENNLIFNMSAALGGGVGVEDYNAFFQTTNTPSEPHGQVSSIDPFVNSAAGDLHLAQATLGGLALGAPYNVDPDGRIRGSDGSWDRGAYEYAGGAPPQTNIYVAQAAAGADTGADCGNAHSAAWFNSVANWGTGPAQIGPGKTLHLCGVVSTQLTVQGSGTSGSPITIFWEPNAKVSLPYCDANGCLNAAGRSFIVFDGGSNGVIENTANGSALAYQIAGNGIAARPCTGCEFKHLAFNNLYVHSSFSDTSGGSGCVYTEGANLKIHDNTAHDNGWCFGIYPGNSSGDIYNNVVSRSNHCFIIGANGAGQNFTGGSIHDNECYDTYVWDDQADANHHDGIHLYAINGAQISNLSIYNNYFHGRWGVNVTAHIYIEGNTGPYWLFNNVMLASNNENYIPLWISGNGCNVYNNTIVVSTTSSPNGTGAYVNGCANAVFKNNVVEGGNANVWMNNTTFASGGLANNVYWNIWNGWKWNNTYYGSLSSWQAGVNANQADAGGDANALVGDPKPDAAGRPQSGSSVVQAGANLTALGIAALDLDRAGVARPALGAWDAGAYAFAGSAVKTPAKPRGLRLQ